MWAEGRVVDGGSGVNASITAADAHDAGEALDDVFGRLSATQLVGVLPNRRSDPDRESIDVSGVDIPSRTPGADCCRLL
jgi:hypothetical protein